MEYRKYVLTILFTIAFLLGKAQELTFQQVDSTSNAQYMAGNWRSLIALGGQAAKSNIDFPRLHVRIAYAYFSVGNYSGTLQQYQQVLVADSRNDTARYLSYPCNSYLIRDAEASYHASFLDTAFLKSKQLSSFGLVAAGLEGGIKLSGS